MARFPRHTNAHFQAAIEWLEANGWTINRDGSITRVRIEVKIPVNRKLVETHGHAPSYRAKVDGKILSFKAAALVADKFGHTIYRPGEARQDGGDPAATERPNEVEVGLGLSFTPETCPEPARVGCDEAEVGLGLSFTPETCPEPARVGSRPASRGPCNACGGHMARIGYPGDPDEWRCFQCGRTGMPPRVLSAEELRAFRQQARMRKRV